MKRIGVLFVCLGNYCRSPLALGLFRAKLAERGLQDHFAVDSSGVTQAHLGKLPDPKIVALTRAVGVDITDSRARLTTAADLAANDHVLVAERAVAEALAAIGPDHTDRIRLLREYEDGADDLDVPDPGQQDEAAYQQTLGIIDRSVGGLLDDLVRRYALDESAR